MDVTFTSTKPGPRYGAVVIEDGSGKVLANTYVFGTGTAPQVAFLPAAQSTLGGGFGQPKEIALDGAGNIYVADQDPNEVKEMPPGCTASVYSDGFCTITTLGSGFDFPTSVAVDDSGNIYLGDFGAATVITERKRHRPPARS